LIKKKSPENLGLFFYAALFLLQCINKLKINETDIPAMANQIDLDK
jgi:hypothetical protein